MRKLLVGTMAAAGSFLMPLAEAQAQSPEQCVPVYDETLTGDSSTHLRQVIGEYATNGVEVHVQILEDATDEGVFSADDAESHSERLEDLCGWNGSNLLNVFISTEPRSYDVYRTGSAKSSISSSRIDSALPYLVDDLRDQSTSYQSDVANLLDRISPYDQPVNNRLGSDNEAIGQETTKEPSKPMDIPLKEILFGISGAAVLGAIGARLKRSLTIKGDIRDSKGAAGEVKADITEQIMNAESLLGILREDDASELREYLAQTQQDLVDIESRQDTALSTYNREKRKLWPDRFVVGNAASDLDEATQDAAASVETLRQEAEQVGNLVGKIDELYNAFKGRIDAIYKLLARKKESGWNVEYFFPKMELFDNTFIEVKKLRDQYYVKKPAELMAGQEEALHAVYAEVESLDDRLHLADQARQRQTTEITEQSQVAEKSVTILKNLRTEYHESCYFDIASLAEEMPRLIDRLRNILEETSQLEGVKSAESLAKYEGLVTEFDSIVESIEASSAGVADRNANLIEIRESLTSSVDEIFERFKDVHRYAFDDHEGDVEDETRELIEQSSREFSDFVESETKIDKPKYLEIAERLEQHRATVDSMITRAQSEKEEMDDLRTSVQQLEHEAQSSLDDLRSYVSSHSYDTNVSYAMTIFSSDTSANRRDLGSQVSRYNDLISSITSAKDEARRDVREAEEERERQREREREQQRQLNAMTTIHSSNNWGSSPGGGGGGSHNSGNW